MLGNGKSLARCLYLLNLVVAVLGLLFHAAAYKIGGGELESAYRGCLAKLQLLNVSINRGYLFFEFSETVVIESYKCCMNAFARLSMKAQLGHE